MRKSQAFIIALIAAALMPAAFARAGVYAHYSFDADYTDDSGNGRNGTLVDASPTGNSGITTTAGQYVFGGGALNLATDLDYVSLTSQTFFSGTAYSIAFWAKKNPTTTNDGTDWDMVIGTRNTTNHFIGLNSNGDYIRWRGNDSTTARQLDGPYPGSFDDQQWHHYAVTAASSGAFSIYIDGAVVASGSKTTGFTYDTIGEAYSFANGFDYYGQIDEVWVFNVALNSAEVAFLANSNVLPTPAALPAGLGLMALMGLRRRR